MKRCTKCGIFKLISDFHKSNSCLDGHHTQCKKCRNKTNREYQRYNPKYFIPKREYAKLSYVKKKKSETAKTYYQKPENRRKQYVNQKVMRSIKKGEIKRNNCEWNGCKESKTVAHHNNYDRPFDIIWLCHKHHMQIHWKVD